MGCGASVSFQHVQNFFGVNDDDEEKSGGSSSSREAAGEVTSVVPFVNTKGSSGGRASQQKAQSSASLGTEDPIRLFGRFEERKARAANEVQMNGCTLRIHHRDIRGDKEVVLLAVTKDGMALEHATDAMKQDLDVVITAVRQTSLALRFVHVSLKEDPMVWTEACMQNGSLLSTASFDLRQNREVVLAAVKQNGTALIFADESLRKDREVVLAAVRQNGSSLIFAAQELRRDKEVVLAAVQQDGFELAHSSEELRRDYDVVYGAVMQNGAALRFAPREFREDPEIVLAAVEHYSEALQYASKSLQVDHQFIQQAISLNPAVLGVVGQIQQEVYLDRSFILSCVVQTPEALEYAPDDLQRDLNLIASLVGEDYSLIDASVRHMSEEEFATHYGDDFFDKDLNVLTARSVHGKNNDVFLSLEDELRRKSQHHLKSLHSPRRRSSSDMSSCSISPVSPRPKSSHSPLKSQKSMASVRSMDHMTESHHRLTNWTTASRWDSVRTGLSSRRSSETNCGAELHEFVLLSSSPSSLCARSTLSYKNLEWRSNTSNDDRSHHDHSSAVEISSRTRIRREATTTYNNAILTKREFILTAMRENTEAMEFLPTEVRRDREVVIALLTDKTFSNGHAEDEKITPPEQLTLERSTSKRSGTKSIDADSEDHLPDVIRITLVPQKLSLTSVERIFKQDRPRYYAEGQGKSALRHAAKALVQADYSMSVPVRGILAAVGQHGAAMVEMKIRGFAVPAAPAPLLHPLDTDKYRASEASNGILEKLASQKGHPKFPADTTYTEEFTGMHSDSIEELALRPKRGTAVSVSSLGMEEADNIDAASISGGSFHTTT